MADEKFAREYGEHLIEQVKKGSMTRRQLLVRASVFGFSATAAGRLLAACGSSGGGSAVTTPSASASAPAVVMGGTMKAVIPPPIKSLDPVTIYDQGGIVLVYQIAEYLIDLSNTNALKPKLALSWAPNAKGDVWTFKLRQGVTFNDGSPFEAADVVASMDRVLDPKSGSGALAALAGILSKGGTKAVDTSTVQFNLDKPFADFPYLVSSSSYNTAMLPRNYAGNFLKSPVGTGPWMLQSYTTNQRAVMKKNPTYWGKDAQGRQLPYLDSVEYVLVTDTSAANLQLQSGAVDVQPQTVFQGGQAILNDPSLRVDVYPSSGIREVAFNVNKTPWQKQGSPPGRGLLPRPPGHQPGAVRRPQQPRLRHVLGAHGVPGQPALDAAQAGLRQGQAAPQHGRSCQRCGRHPHGGQLPGEPGLRPAHPGAVQARRHQRQDQRDQLQRLLRRHQQQHAVAQRAHGHRGVGQPAHAGRVRPGHAAADQRVELLALERTRSSLTTFNQYESTTDEATRTQLATKLSQIQQDETPILVAFFISQLRTQKKNVYGIQGPGSFYFDVSQAYMTK